MSSRYFDGGDGGRGRSDNNEDRSSHKDASHDKVTGKKAQMGLRLLVDTNGDHWHYVLSLSAATRFMAIILELFEDVITKTVDYHLFDVVVEFHRCVFLSYLKVVFIAGH
ncbi:hypothetical protein Tco_1006259 [Tanacetum coccineum]|uniref:Uncharacterized protein n=1 Tax=Tanacetum coccineum TaxID=301880 RepID=A0ABQ5FHE3_9ASTR